MGYAERMARRQRRKDRRWGQDFANPMDAEMTANRGMLDAGTQMAGGQYQDAFGDLGQAKAGFDSLASGDGPSLAQAQLETQSGKNIASQMAMAGQARGGNMAAMSNAAAATGSGMQIATNQQAAELRAQEQLAAMSASAGLAGQMADMSSGRELDQMGMGQNALFTQQGTQAQMAGARNAMRADRKRSNREFGLGIAQQSVGAVDSAAGAAGTLSDMRVKKNIRRARSPMAVLLLGSGDDEGCEDHGPMGGECSVCGEDHGPDLPVPDYEYDEKERKRAGEIRRAHEDADGDRPSLASRMAARATFSKTKPYEYEYTDEALRKGMPKGKIVGVMAQDLEKSPGGREVVGEGEDGRKWLDGPKSLSLVLAGAADHEARLAEIERQMKGKGW